MKTRQWSISNSGNCIKGNRRVLILNSQWVPSPREKTMFNVVKMGYLNFWSVLQSLFTSFTLIHLKACNCGMPASPKTLTSLTIYSIKVAGRDAETHPGYSTGTRHTETSRRSWMECHDRHTYTSNYVDNWGLIDPWGNPHGQGDPTEKTSTSGSYPGSSLWSNSATSLQKFSYAASTSQQTKWDPTNQINTANRYLLWQPNKSSQLYL